jgi:hypothetical protein
LVVAEYLPNLNFNPAFDVGFFIVCFPRKRFLAQRLRRSLISKIFPSLLGIVFARVSHFGHLREFLHHWTLT